MLALLKKKKSPSQPCAHQRNTSKTPETSLQHSDPPKTETPGGLNPSTSEAPAEQIGNENQLDQKILNESPESKGAQAGNSPCSVCKAEKRAARRYRWLLITGLFFPFTVQALDATIIAGALPFIASDFHELSQLNWIVSAFNLTAATFIPAWGQIADIFGRHAAIQTALVLMLIGSSLCAGAPTNAFPMLLVGRALQGIGCAGIGMLTRVILADKVSLKENAKNNTIFALVGGLGYGFGPTIGGYLTQVTWRWCFILNVPIAVIGMVFGFFLLRPELLGPQNIPGVDDTTELHGIKAFKIKLLTIDYGGQILFLFGMGLLVLALTWGGSYYPWSDVRVLAPLVIGFVTFSAFVVWEFLMAPGRKLATMFPQQTAMIPFKLIWSRNAGLLIYINFVTGMALYAVFYFVDIYFALVLSYPSGQAGTQLLYYTPGLGVGAYLAMFACNIYPRQTWFPLAFGTLIEPLGMTLLAVAINMDNVPLICGMLGLAGVGTGIRFMPGTLHGVGYFRNHIASITALMGLALSLGGTFSMTLMFTVFNNSLQNAGINLKGNSSSSFDQISGLSQDSQNYLRDQVRKAISLSFFALCSFLWLALVAIAFMGNVNITNKAKGLKSEGEGDSNENAVKGSFIGSWFRKQSTHVPREKTQPGGQEQDMETGRA